MILINRKLKISLTIILTYFGIQLAFSQTDSNKCTITYIANEGFLIETKNHKILVDALFGGIKGNWCDQPSDSIINLMLDGDPPFNNIDIVLVTHKHTDHFNPSLVIKFLFNNPSTKLVCSKQVSDLLYKDSLYKRILKNIYSLETNIPYQSNIGLNGINIGILGFNHGSFIEKDSLGNLYDLHRDINNIGYLVDIDGFKILHTGDASPASNKDIYNKYGLSEIELDIAFLDRVFLRSEGQELLNGTINTKKIVLMHIEPSKANFFESYAASIPMLVVFNKSMEKKEFVK